MTKKPPTVLIYFTVDSDPKFAKSVLQGSTFTQRELCTVYAGNESAKIIEKSPPTVRCWFEFHATMAENVKILKEIVQIISGGDNQLALEKLAELLSSFDKAIAKGILDLNLLHFEEGCGEDLYKAFYRKRFIEAASLTVHQGFEAQIKAAQAIASKIKKEREQQKYKSKKINQSKGSGSGSNKRPFYHNQNGGVSRQNSSNHHGGGWGSSNSHSRQGGGFHRGHNSHHQKFFPQSNYPKPPLPPPPPGKPHGT